MQDCGVQEISLIGDVRGLGAMVAIELAKTVRLGTAGETNKLSVPAMQRPDCAQGRHLTM